MSDASDSTMDRMDVCLGLLRYFSERITRGCNLKGGCLLWAVMSTTQVECNGMRIEINERKAIISNNKCAHNDNNADCILGTPDVING